MQSVCNDSEGSYDERKVDSIMEGVGGGLGAITCTVALVFAIVSRFYKDIVQRLILYKLVAMLVFSLSQLLFGIHQCDDDRSDTYKVLSLVIPHIAYCVNLALTFWLTIILYFCIVRLKELKNFKKLEPIVVISSCLPLAIAVYVPFLSYNDSSGKITVQFSTEGNNEMLYVLIPGYAIAGILYFILSILVIIICIVAIRRSFWKYDNDTAESLLLATNNKWKMLSKQLLPLVVYPIVNAVAAPLFFPLLVLHFDGNNSKGVFLYSLISSSGLITGIIVIIHLCILKCKKKQRERKRMKQNDKEQEALCIVPNHYTDVFTSETVASTNAHTTYRFTRTSSFITTV